MVARFHFTIECLTLGSDTLPNGASTMGEYFRGWKRKLGLVALVLACSFAAGWLRGVFRGELIHLPNQLAIVNERHALSLVKPQKMPNWPSFIHSQYRVWNGFELAPILSVPYWSLVLPLTAVSAWFLLSRQPQPKAIKPPTN